ncbi:MAG: phosphatidylserine decarboxylase [Oscillospiraceae bacterium]|jgi:phosphatidylserine decarboxylase|nr:phosphatidylserine decarboxylase [Oscillospiraceae bacterium]
MRTVYHRASGKLLEEAEVGAGAMRFVYETSFGRLLAKGILCRRFVSNLYAAWQKSPFSRSKVRKFIRRYDIDLRECTTQDFRNFNDFFTRKRARCEDFTKAAQLPAIADSKLTAAEIAADTTLSVKGVPYTLGELLDNAALAQEYAGGLCLIFRLSPDDYHRYAYPDSGVQEKTRYIPGVLHSVNPVAAAQRVYRRNARCYTVLHTAHFGDVLQMEVGAMLVGKIHNHREDAGASFEKLAEKGYFAYGGSTVILLLKKNAVALDADILHYSKQDIECKVRTGEKIGSATTK